MGRIPFSEARGDVGTPARPTGAVPVARRRRGVSPGGWRCSGARRCRGAARAVVRAPSAAASILAVRLAYVAPVASLDVAVAYGARSGAGGAPVDCFRTDVDMYDLSLAIDSLSRLARHILSPVAISRKRSGH